MTNEQKFKQVFGFPPITNTCPSSDCKKCPLRNLHKKEWYCSSQEEQYNWWQSEYKENKE